MNPQQKNEVFYHGYDLVVSRGPLRRSAREKEPDTARAILMCETCDKPTRHDFVGRQRLSSKRSPQISCDEFVYCCRVCKHDRVWGTEDLEASAPASKK